MLFVHWYKGLPLSVLISYGQASGSWGKGGPGYDSGLYDIHSNFSLIINSVSVEDNDHFMCELVVRGNLDPFENSTNVTVFGKPHEIYFLKYVFVSYKHIYFFKVKASMHPLK